MTGEGNQFLETIIMLHLFSTDLTIICRDQLRLLSSFVGVGFPDSLAISPFWTRELQQ